MFTVRRLGLLFQAIVAGTGCGTGGDDAADADATTDATYEASCTALCIPDAVIDSYVAWCEAGPPEVIANDGCYAYFSVPCGVPAGDYVTNDAGSLNRCDQVCIGVMAQSCEETTNPYDFFDAGDAAAPDGGPLVYVRCDCGTSGRRPVGLRRRLRRETSMLAAYFSEMAHLEAAAAPAFVRLRRELEALGAPRRLLARVARAERDEARHARTTARLARAFGGTAAPARVRTFRARGPFAVARENAVEGCVRETFGALVATWQAAHAGDPRVKRLMATIARDETSHAAVSWAAARFLDTRLDAKQRSKLVAARQRAITTLYDTREPPHELVRVAGLPRARDAHRLLDELRARVWL